MSDDFAAHFEKDVQPETTEGQGQPRDESGRFAPKADQQPEPQAQPTPEPAQSAPAVQAAPAPVAQPEPAKAEPGHVPINALLDEREKRQKLEKRLADLEQQTRQPQNIPSVTDDPEAFAQHQQLLIQQTATNTRFETSELVARQQHGDDPVQKAMDWAMQRSQESPAFAAEYLKQKHPIDWAVRQQKRHALLDDIGDDPEAYRARIIAEFQLRQTQRPACTRSPRHPTQPAAAKPAPRPSLASAPISGRNTDGPRARPRFEAAFSNR
jgi:hypothetical protein